MEKLIKGIPAREYHRQYYQNHKMNYREYFKCFYYGKTKYVWVAKNDLQIKVFDKKSKLADYLGYSEATIINRLRDKKPIQGFYLYKMLRTEYEKEIK